MPKKSRKAKAKRAAPNDTFDGAWSSNPALIRRFLSSAPLHEQLAGEVRYQLHQVLRKRNIEIAAVTSRAKAIESFLQKLDRKHYDDPFEEMSDLSGVRVVHLYLSDFADIESVVREEFTVLEKVDKLAEHGEDRFGYGARHFVVQLGDRFAGARYDDLKNLKCEIQVRTALQDAWAIISHHLIYKRESDIPTSLKRRINSLAGLFETADDQFEHLRSDRAEYIAGLQEVASNDVAFLGQEINPDTVRVYLEKRFPERNVGDGLEFTLSDLDRETYKTINDLQLMLRRTEKAREALYSERPSTTNFSGGILGVSLALDNPVHRKIGWLREMVELFEKYEHLVDRDA